MENNFKPKKEDNIFVEYHGELMQNFFSESAIDSTQGLQSVKYATDKSILFFIDKHDVLKALFQVDNSPTGWTSCNISQIEYKITAYDIHHDETNNTLKIAYSRTNAGTSHLMVSEEITLTGLNPAKFWDSVQWKKITPQNPSKIIDHISMNQTGLLYSTSYRYHDATYVYFRFDNPVLTEYTLPENTLHVHQIEVGQIYGEFGTFLLYDMKKERTMLFQSFPDPEYGEVSTYRFQPVEQLNAFYTMPDEEGNDILYLSGDGIFKFMNPDDGSITICKSGGPTQFHKIDVSTEGEETTIWAIGENDGNKGLYYLTNRFYESSKKINTEKWTTPIQMETAVEEFSSVKGSDFTNELFLLGSEDNSYSLIHFFQDGVSTNWQEHPVVLEELREVKTSETFTLNLQFKSDDRMVAFHGEKAEISAESNMYVYIDGKKTALGPDKSCEVTIHDDYVNLVYPTKSIGASHIYVNADFLKKKVSIDPAHKFKKKFKAKMGDATKLKQAKLSDGRSLIPNDVSHEVLNQIVSVTNETYEKLDLLKNKVSDVASGAVHYVADSEIGRQVGNMVSSVGHALGDLWHSVKKGFLKITKFIVEKVKEGVKFIIKIGKQIFEWVSKVASDVFHFLERVWEKIKVFFKDLFEYLGYLFSWEDITRTKRVMKEYLTTMIVSLSKEMTSVKEKTYNFFEEAKDKIEDLKKEIAFQQLNDRSLQQLKSENAKNDKIDPRANWMGAKKKHITDSDNQKQVVNAVPDGVLESVGGAAGKLMHHFEVLGKQLVEIFTDLKDRFLDVIHGRMKIGDFLEYLVLSLLELGIAVAQEIIDLIFEILITVIKVATSVLNTTLDIPFFSKFYKTFIGKGDNLSLSELICLLIAIPTTVVYKIGEGEVPFKNASDREEFLNGAKTMFQLD